MKLSTALNKVKWLQSDDIRPYVFVRPENQIQAPGTRHNTDWFKKEPIYKNPLDLKELPFAEAIYQLEWKAFGDREMAIPRWVFYDCAAMPGFIAGFAQRTSSLPEIMQKLLSVNAETSEWCPLSLFVIIPTMHKGEWVAYDLCAINSLLTKEQQYYGLGFLSKAFALWYANVEQCSGMTQWGSPSLKLHSSYGHLELIGAYAPLHTHANTMTYRCQVNVNSWEKFFTKEEDLSFVENYAPTDLWINPKDEKSQIEIQNKIQNQEGPFYLSASHILKNKLTDPMQLYKLKKEF